MMRLSIISWAFDLNRLMSSAGTSSVLRRSIEKTVYSLAEGFGIRPMHPARYHHRRPRLRAAATGLPRQSRLKASDHHLSVDW